MGQVLKVQLFRDARHPGGDGGERGSALGSDVVGRNTASEEQDGNGERVGVSMPADTKASTWAEAHSKLSIFVCGRTSKSLSRPDMSWPLLVRLLLLILQAGGGVGTVRHHECQGALTRKRTLFRRQRTQGW